MSDLLIKDLDKEMTEVETEAGVIAMIDLLIKDCTVLYFSSARTKSD